MFGLTLRDKFDPDAESYIAAVELADGQPLEAEVKVAITRFVKGCKDDGIWDSVRDSCILAGARTLAGSLIPLKGTAPTNVGFLSGDYNRKTGLKGNGNGKFLNSNKKGNSYPQSNFHVCVYKTTTETQIGLTQVLFGVGGGDPGSIVIGLTDTSVNSVFTRMISSVVNVPQQPILFAGFQGLTRNATNNYIYRSNGNNQVVNTNAETQDSRDIHIFARNNTVRSFSQARISFYSIGQSLDLAKLDTRLIALMSAFNRYIP